MLGLPAKMPVDGQSESKNVDRDVGRLFPPVALVLPSFRCCVVSRTTIVVQRGRLVLGDAELNHPSPW